MHKQLKQCMYGFFVGASYESMNNTEWIKNKLHENLEFASIDLAKSNCEKDEDCQGVYDDRCDGQDEFYLCDRKGELKPSDNCCVHRKTY